MITQKLNDIQVIVNELKNYQPTYLGHKEAEKLRLWAMMINEDVYYITQHYIRAFRSHGGV